MVHQSGMSRSCSQPASRQHGRSKQSSLLLILLAAATTVALLSKKAAGRRPDPALGYGSSQLDPRVNYSTLLKPRYHLTAPYGWMNDPNGMFQQDGGAVHVFYQWNPAEPKWGSPWWGHVMSKDYVKWKRLPPALKPDQWYDSDGVFSGSATILPNGSPFMMYTGVMNFSQYGFYYQQQAAAIPANLSDPLFVNWTKLATNPLSMSTPPGGTHAQFRDPTTAWQVAPHSEDLDALVTALRGPGKSAGSSPVRSSASSNSTAGNNTMGNGTSADQRATEDMPVAPPPGFNHSEEAHRAAGSVQVAGVWMSAVGALDDCLGTAALYLSNDSLRTWKYAGTLYSQLGQNFTQYAACLPPADKRDAPANKWDAPAGARSYGQYCDQFGKHCRMWECPDFFPVDSAVQAFKYSDQARGRDPWAADWYILGDTSLINYSYALVQDARDAYNGLLDGKPYAARPLDYGIVYASKTFRPANSTRTLWLGWVYEQSLYCTEVCSNATSFILDYLGWQGAQTLMREVTYIPETQTLRFQPMAELKKLRHMPALVDTQFTLDTQAVAQRGKQSEDGYAHAVIMPGREPDAVLQMMLQRFIRGGNQAANLPWLGASSDLQGSLDRKIHSMSGGRQVEVLLSFTLHMNPSKQQRSTAQQLQPLALIVRIHTGGGTYTDVLLNGTCDCSSMTAAIHNGTMSGVATPSLQKLHVHVDRTHSGGQSTNDTKQQGGQVPLPRGMQASDVQLQMFVDRSIVEVYVMQGAAVVTSRIYPTPVLPQDGPASMSPASSTAAGGNASQDPPALGTWGYELLGQWEGGWVDVQAQVFEMSDCWEDS